MRKLAVGLTAVTIALVLAVSVRSELAKRAPILPPVPSSVVPASQPAPDSPVATVATEAEVTPPDALAPAASSQAVPVATPAVAPAGATDLEAPHTPPDGGAAQETDPQAIIKRAATAYSNVRSMKASFTQTMVNPLLNRRSTSRGTIYQQRPDKFLMRFSEPAGDVIVSDGSAFWIYYPSSDPKQVIKAPASSGAGAVDLQAQFLGDPVRRFNAKLNGTEPVDSRAAHVITLTPKGDEGYRSLKVWVDQKDYLVRRFEITDMNNATRLINLSGVQINVPLEAGLFRFTPPQGARIVERG